MKWFEKILILLLVSGLTYNIFAQKTGAAEKPRILVTSDGEIDDQCSMIRFLLYTNEWDVEGIITSSSQYHWRGHKWAGDDWVQPFLEAYAKVYPNLIKHDNLYPSAEFLQERTFLGNVESEGEMDSITPGSQHIVKVLLDESDDRPIWIQAWGGTNTIARALKTIEDEHSDKMAYVANKIRFFFIWEQDTTYQGYIRKNWGKYNILTIICDQFWAIAYEWDKILPPDKIKYFKADWMKSNILENHGPLCSLYQAYKDNSDNEGFKERDFKSAGDFRSEGDSPAFIYTIRNGLSDGNLDHPDWGGWGGRYTKVRENTWLDPVSETNYTYPEGRWYTGTAWGRNYMRNEYPKNPELMREYFQPIVRWVDAFQNDFAARADWCVKSYEDANHSPVVVLAHDLVIKDSCGANIKLSAKGTTDPDGDNLEYSWWQYKEAGSFKGNINLCDSDKQDASFTVPEDAEKGNTIHIICEVTDSGTPALTRYQRVVVKVE